MESLSTLTEETRRKIDLECAWNVVRNNFDASRPRRYVSGIAVASKKHNSNGDAFIARGLNVTLPVLLLLDHDPTMAIGKVFAIEARDDQVLFKAEVCNSGRLLWLDDAWMQVVCKFMTSASIGPRNLANYRPLDSTFDNFTVDEISISQQGADPGARVCRVWEVAPVVHLHRPSITEFWSSP